MNTGGITEFVPLPFVAREAPLYRRGLSRRGPTRDESRAMHAIARIVLGDLIPNIQASWTKLGQEEALHMLSIGVNDLGGCLMNESISRAAGASHGQCWSPSAMVHAIDSVRRTPVQRTTTYDLVSPSKAHPRVEGGLSLLPIELSPAAQRANRR